MPKFEVKIDGFDEVIAQLEELESDAKKVTEEALKATHAHVTQKLEKAVKPHKQTGVTERSLKKDAEINWFGSTAKVNVGFDISKGGLPSVFLMYGTPRMKKDPKLYATLYGKKTEKEIKEIQEDMFYDAIRKGGG